MQKLKLKKLEDAISARGEIMLTKTRARIKKLEVEIKELREELQKTRNRVDDLSEIQQGERTVRKKIKIYILAIKYWFQGDPWTEAIKYAEALVHGFK